VTCLSKGESRTAISTFLPGVRGTIDTLYLTEPPGNIWLQVEDIRDKIILGIHPKVYLILYCIPAEKSS